MYIVYKGWVGAPMGVGMKYSKPFACICKHTATPIHIWRGCPAEVGYLTVSAYECFLDLGFALQPVSYSLQSGQRSHPNPSTLDVDTLRQDWSANV